MAHAPLRWLENFASATCVNSLRPDVTCNSISVAETGYALLIGAMGAAEDVSIVLHPMPNDAAPAMRAGGRESLNCAFETVEHHGTPTHSDFEGSCRNHCRIARIWPCFDSFNEGGGNSLVPSMRHRLLR
jgi:hypothetical protein